MKAKCIIIGSGPAALMAADLLSERGIAVSLFEKRSGPAWKLLVAGSTGLNVSFACAPAELANFYFSRKKELTACFSAFGSEDWLNHLRGLGEEPYLGTSKRYFIRTWKATSLLDAWLKRLRERGVELNYQEEFSSFEKRGDGKICAKFSSGREETGDALLLALGGASWEEKLPPWPKSLAEKGIEVFPFAASNVGYRIAAPQAFFQEAQGKPIKGLILHTARGTKQGEMMITKYGFEGTPVYTVGTVGPATMDLKPELPEDRLIIRLKQGTGSMEERVVRLAKLSEGALLLVKYLAPQGAYATAESAAAMLKRFPVVLTEARPLAEAISSSGGVSWEELTHGMEIRKFPGIFCAGEMIDWDAPTGGFLLQACISTAAVAADAIRRKLEPDPRGEINS